MADLMLPQVVPALNAGFQYGQQQATNKALGNYISSGGNDAASLAQAAQNDPMAALKTQGAVNEQNQAISQQTQTKAVNMAKFIQSAPDQFKDQAYQQVKPFLASLGVSQVPDHYDASVAQAVQGIVNAYTPSNQLPEKVREVQQLGSIAGYGAGSPELANAAAIALRTKSPAATGGFSFTKVQDDQGNERLVRQDPTTGNIDVQDASGNWQPYGGSGQRGAVRGTGGLPAETQAYPGKVFAALDGRSATNPDGTPSDALLDAVKQVESSGNPNAVSPAGAQGPYQLMAGTASDLGVNPNDESQARAGAKSYLTALLKGSGGDVARALQGYNAGPGRVGVSLIGLSPGQKAAQEQTAKEQAQLAYLPQNEQIKSDYAVQTAAKKAAAENQAKSASEAQQKTIQSQQDAQKTLSLLDAAEPLLHQATGGALGHLGNEIAGAAGYSTPSAKAQAQLKVLAGQLTSSVPRMQGPQSDKDVQLYREMAGDFANESIPVESRLAALQGIRALQQKYLNQPVQSGIARPTGQEPGAQASSGGWAIQRVE